MSWRFPTFLAVTFSLMATVVGCSDNIPDPVASPVTVTTTTTSVSTRVSTVTETVQVEESADPIAEEEPAGTPVSAPVRASQQDKIYGQVIRGYGVDITDDQVAQVGGPVCDSYDAGGGLDAALGVIESITGHTGWQATKIAQGVVVGRCSQYVDLTY